jgi:hypothetical protein
MIKVWRVQGRDGRGPYAPGFSRKWCDDAGPIPPPTCFEEFPDLERLVATKRLLHGGHYGSGVLALEDIGRWFTPTECRKLLKLRFHLVRMDVDDILAQSVNQVVFWRSRPLREGIQMVPFPALVTT